MKGEQQSSKKTIPIITEGQMRALIRVQNRLKMNRKQRKFGLARNKKPFKHLKPWDNEFATSSESANEPKLFIGFDRKGRPNPVKKEPDPVGERLQQLEKIRRLSTKRKQIRKTNHIVCIT